ncbi:MAG: DUF739 family protein [Clostridia bacterium]|jgi:hypothetical protein|nr:DUF739 family protein [Clostridia bacterium]
MENELVFCYDRLLGRIIEKFKTRENFASKINMSIPTLISKLSGKVDFKSKEIFEFCIVLEIPLEQIANFFYQTT